MGIGVAGLMAGLVVGALVFQDKSAPEKTPESAATRAAPVRKPKAAAPDSARVPDFVGKAADAAEAASKEAPKKPLSLDDEPPEPEAPVLASKELSPALNSAIGADSWFLSHRQYLHKSLGAGAFATETAVTPRGKAVLDWLRSLESHAIDPKLYKLPDVEGLATLDRRTSEQTVELEVALGKSVVRLALDFRVLRWAGPFNLVSEKRAAEKAPLKRKLKRIVGQLALAEPQEFAKVLRPPHTAYAPMQKAYERYAGFADAKCKDLDPGMSLRPPKDGKPGSRGGAVKALQERLACEGLYAGEITGVYDEATLAGVQRYQREHDLSAGGWVKKMTVKSMNVPLSRRRDQIGLSLQRLRESDIWKLTDEFRLIVNIPSFSMRAESNGQIVKRHKVIVGTNRLDDDKQALVQGHLNRTKLFVSNLYRVIINPAWILPSRITNGELVGKVEADPEYLDKMNIKKKTLADGKEVLVQGFGSGNVLGKVKFLLEKTNAIFLHDTDKRGLFRERRRDFSHGCMRVHNAVGFARWILQRDGWDDKEIEKSFKLERTQRGMDLKKPISFMTEYLTVDINAAGNPVFLSDIYGYDKAYFEKSLPPKTKVRWGDLRLRPSWVPRVKKEVVDGWRRAGKPAPRNYDPKKHGG